MQLVLAEVGIGNRADIEIRGEYRAGDGGDEPIVILEAGLGERFSCCSRRIKPLQPPCASGEIEPSVGGRSGGCGFGRATGPPRP